jgi:hypothetical protein
VVLKEEVRHARPQGAPPSTAAVTAPLRPKELWPLLPVFRQQAIVRLLSELIHRHLLGPADKEVANEPR